MSTAPTPSNEPERIAVLRSLDILDTAREEIYEQVTAAAAQACHTPISLLSFVDDNRMWCKSHCGVEWQSIPRCVSFCAHAICQSDLFIVEDAHQDERFRDHPLVKGEHGIRFYAGFPLRTRDGHALGTLCVLDRVPRQLDEQQKAALERLGESAARILELRRKDGSSLFAAAANISTDGIAITDATHPGCPIVYVNRSFLHLTECKYHEVIGRDYLFPCPDRTSSESWAEAGT
jgi:GAF domain-containing protein